MRATLKRRFQATCMWLAACSTSSACSIKMRSWWRWMLSIAWATMRVWGRRGLWSRSSWGMASTEKGIWYRDWRVRNGSFDTSNSRTGRTKRRLSSWWWICCTPPSVNITLKSLQNISDTILLSFYSFSNSSIKKIYHLVRTSMMVWFIAFYELNFTTWIPGIFCTDSMLITWVPSDKV